MMPTVSVIIPTYNRADYILDAIESVFAQTYSDYEIIVVDDDSIDNTAELLRPLVEMGRLRYERRGCGSAPATRNEGIRQARGKYIAFLDSDDVFMPHKLEEQVALLDRNPDIALVHGGYEKFSDDGRKLGYRDTSKIAGMVYPKMLLDWSVLIATPCVIVRKSVLDEVGYFDESMKRAEDLDLWRRVAMRYKLASVPETVVRVRVHAGNISYGKVGAATFFERYLQKAFQDDPSLSDIFRRRAFAKLYSNLGHNILAEGRQDQMNSVRIYSLKAIKFWPMQWSAYLGWLGSILPPRIRDGLLQMWRKIRYS